MDWPASDRITDEIRTIMAREVKAGVDPITLLAGQLQALLDLVESAPLPGMPQTVFSLGMAYLAIFTEYPDPRV